MSSNWLSLLVVGLVLFAGCSGVGGSDTAVESDDSMTTNATPEQTVDGTTPAVETTTEATEDTSPEFGTEFVSVSPLQNQSQYTEWPDSQAVHFENLSESQQAVFLDALDGQVVFGPDEENPFAFSDRDRPEVVKYEGTWYLVRVAIV